MDQQIDRRKSRRSFLIGVLAILISFGTPKRAGASFCIKPATRYVLSCKSVQCDKGVKVEYEYAGLGFCSTIPELHEINDKEIAIINDWREETEQYDLVGIIEYDLLGECGFARECSKWIKTLSYDEGLEYEQVVQGLNNTVRKEIIRFYIDESLYIFYLTIPSLIGILLPFILFRHRKHYWLRFGLVFSIQILWVFYFWATAICCGDRWTDFFSTIACFVMLVELIIIIIMRPRTDEMIT
jgi:hypothetical protein